MRKIWPQSLFAIVLICAFIQPGFGYFSKFLELSTNTLEYQILKAPDSFSLKIAVLIASGVSEENLAGYTNQIQILENEIRKSVTNDSAYSNAQIIFTEMHKKILKQYNEPSTTLDVALRSGKFNCLSATVLYHVLLEDFGFTPKAVLLPTHVFTTLTIDGKEIDVENTSPFGFDIRENKNAQDNFRKLTGFTYARDSKSVELLDQKGLLAYTYNNIAYFAQRAHQIKSVFQNCLKDAALDGSSRSTVSNIAAGYTEWALYLADSSRDYQQAMDVLAEGMDKLPFQGLFVSNYHYTAERYIDSLVASSHYDDALKAYQDATKRIGNDPQYLEDVYIRILYNLINRDQNFDLAYQYIREARKAVPTSHNIDTLELNGLNIIQKKMVENWKEFPKGEDIVVKWARLSTNSNMNIALEIYYNDSAIRFANNNLRDQSIAAFKYGLTRIPWSAYLSNNISVVAVNTANQYFGKKDLKHYLSYATLALQYTPDNQQLRDSIAIVYKNKLEARLTAEDYDGAREILDEALKYAPKDDKLLYYQNYLKRKLSRKK